MKEFLKKFSFVRSISARRKRWWWQLKSDPDMLDTFLQWIYEKRQKRIVLNVPTPKEKDLINWLREKVHALPPLVPGPDTPGPERMWMGYKNKLREHLRTKDPREFLTWSEVVGTMNAKLRRRNWSRLKRFSFWGEWARRFVVSQTKNQYPSRFFTKADGAVMQQVYHLGQLRHELGTDVKDLDLIVEFGGGFGAMFLAARGLGFKGEYVLFDWAEFLLLQEFYFKWHGVDTSNIKFVSTFAELKAVVGDKQGLLIGLWSISETGEALRDELFKTFNASDFLIGYQPQVAEVDNYEYFTGFAKSRSDIEWRDTPSPNLPGGDNHWLMGKAKI